MGGGGGGERGVGGAPGYLDFEVEIGAGVGREYPVVVRSPAGGARETMRFPFDELALENRLLAVQNVLLRGIGLTRSVAARPPEERTVEAFGRALFEALLPGTALNRYDVCRQLAAEAGKGLRLRLQVRDPALAALPWEFLYDPRRGDYVCLSQRTPLVRHLDLPEPVGVLAVTPPLRILGLVASPPGLPALDVARERERVERAIGPLAARGLMELVWLDGQTWEALQEAMWAGPWHVFHFVGHGGFDADAGEGHLALARGEGGEAGGPGGQGVYRLSAVSLGRLLADHAPLRLAVLNACEGARGSGRDVFSGTAATLVRMGLPAVVAMQYAVTDRAAIQFARTFYRALASTRPVDAAVAAARQAVSLAAPESLEWATPVLYLRAPEAVLFGLRAADRAALPDDAATPDVPRSAPRTAAAPPTAAAAADGAAAAAQLRESDLETQALAAYWTKRWDRAVALLEELHGLRPADAGVADRLEAARRQQHLAAGYAAAEQALEAGTPAEAVERLEAVVALDPAYRDAAALLATARQRRELAELYAEAERLHGAGQWAAVEAVFGRIRALDAAAPDPDGLLASARAARTAEERPRRAAALYGEGTRLLDAGELEAARARLQELQSLEPGYEQTDALLERIAEEVRARREAVRRPLAPQAQPPPLPPSVRKALSIVLAIFILILLLLLLSVIRYQMSGSFE